jgi:hypothetical protein
MNVQDLIAKISLALSMFVPKAIEKDGFLRFIEAEKIVTKVMDESGIKDNLKLQAQVKIMSEALGKIADPRKRDHSEPDAYTQVGCLMNIASEALESAESV